MDAIRIHQPCNTCGSSDALAIYTDHTYCFSCGTHKSIRDNILDNTEKTVDINGLHKALVKRKITEDSCRFYDVRTDVDNKKIEFVYKTVDGLFSAVKTRDTEKNFRISGDWKNAEPLFGMHLFGAGSAKTVTVTEGEIDALSAFQMTGSRWPCVSIRSGAQGALKDCKAAYEWLDKFDNIVISFDDDEPGRKAANDVANLFAGKAKVMRHRKGHKDANDYLVNGDSKEFTDAFWSAELYTSDGIVNTSVLWELVSSPVESAPVDYPWDGLNKLTYGIRPAELVVLSAGSGLGKSQVLREIAYHILRKTEDNIGMLFLEENVRKTMLGLMSISANKLLHIPTTEVNPEEKKQAFDDTHGTGRIYAFDHFGSLEVDNVIGKVREMAKARSCKYIFLDHITMVVSAQTNGDERKALDEVMTKLRMLVQETGVSLFAVSHLKRPDGKGHEEGAATSLAQLRGSGAIGQLSDLVIGLERNGQAEDIQERNTTKVRVLKSRFCGITGPACKLLYSHDTGRLSEMTESF